MHIVCVCVHTHTHTHTHIQTHTHTHTHLRKHAQLSETLDAHGRGQRAQTWRAAGAQDHEVLGLCEGRQTCRLIVGGFLGTELGGGHGCKRRPRARRLENSICIAAPRVVCGRVVHVVLGGVDYVVLQAQDLLTVSVSQARVPLAPA